MKLKKILLPLSLVALLATLTVPAKAQNGTMTPYSRYGYGMLNDNATSAQRGMGSVGYAMRSGRQINVMNPASYAAIDSMTFLFDMGVSLSALWSQENGNTERSFGGGLEYITMQVPIGKRMGASAGILPYASTGYAFGGDIENGSTQRSGSGSINQAYLGFAGRPFDGLSLGFNFAYLFGNTVNDLYTMTSTSSSTMFQRNMSVRDWHLDLGVQYGFNVGRRNRVTLGLTFSPGKDLHGHTYGVYYDGATHNSNATADTVGYTSLKGLYSLPESWGAGINYEWNHSLMVEADFTYQPWKNVKFAKIENFESTEFADRWRLGLGMQYTPNPRGGYGRRIQYRAGTYYNHDYLMIRGNNIREYGITLGLGLPVPNFKSIVNLGLEWKHRQCSPVALIKENYFNITIGINFNEMWFRKSRIY